MTDPTGHLVKAGHVCVLPARGEQQPGAVWECTCRRRWWLSPGRNWYRSWQRFIWPLVEALG